MKISGAFWLDAASRMLLGGFFAFCAVTFLKHTLALLVGMDFLRPTLTQTADIMSGFAVATFMGLTAWLCAVRLPPRTGFAGWIPAAAAFFGSFVTFGLLLLEPRVALSPAERLLSLSLILTGNVCSVYALHHLGRSFSILPQGRQLVTDGPYRFVRHPLYLAEFISIAGVAIHFLSFLALTLIAAQVFCQVMRMTFEEKVLGAAFPEYQDYRRRTARLLPGIY